MSDDRLLRVDVTLAPGRRGSAGLRAELALVPGVHLLFGASGAGKTSLLCMIAGLLRPDAGRIAVGDQVLFDHSRAIDLAPERRGIGLLFQALALFPHLSARENVAFGARGNRRERRNQAHHWLSRMRVSHVAERRPATLSGGEAQRVALARALASRPRVLLLDEPFSALDEKLRMELAEEVAEIARELELVCLLVTHDRSEAARHAGRVLELVDGHVTQLALRRGAGVSSASSCS